MWATVYDIVWSVMGIAFMLFVVYVSMTCVVDARYYEERRREYWRNRALQALEEQDAYTGDTQELDITDLYTAGSEDAMLDP